jgi:hypothetical protein
MLPPSVGQSRLFGRRQNFSGAEKVGIGTVRDDRKNNLG